MKRLAFRVRPALAACVLVVLLGGCATARNELGLSDGACYVTLPHATAAVQHHGKLLGVRLMTVSSLRGSAPDVFVAAQPGGKQARVCLVGYRGRFSADGVERPRGRQHGEVAVVVLSYPGNRLLATVIANHPPLHFGHSHLAAG